MGRGGRVRFSDGDRRRRVEHRHHLHRTAARPEDVVASVAALHSSDPVTPYLANWARVPGFGAEHLDNLLYEDKGVVRMHTVRQTLFLVGVADLPAFHAGGTVEIARKERAKLLKWLGPQMSEERATTWLGGLTEQILEVLTGEELTTREITDRVPELGHEITVGSGRWQTTVPVSSRLLFLLAMEGVLVRGSPLGTWRSSQYRWARADGWLPRLEVMDEADGRVGIVRRYLETHSPATFNDIKWWTGWTVGNTRAALAALDISEVELGGGEVGFILEGDHDRDTDSGSVAFLPGLDSTTMGWKERDWYLGEYATALFDAAGNAGPTIWVDGRVVGGWGQSQDGTVVYDLLEELPRRKSDAVREEAARLGEWLGDQVVMPRFPSPVGRRLALSP